MAGDRWGIEGPPPEAYSRVSYPERYGPLHAFALGLLDRLTASFDVSREEGASLDAELQFRGLTGPTVRIAPRDSGAAPLTVAFTDFPGLAIGLGRWHVDRFPRCGCDACDEDTEALGEELEALVSDLTSGRMREAVLLPAVGEAWVEWAVWSRDGSWRGSRTRISRKRARQLLSETDRSEFHWAAWPRRQTGETA